jgi:ubiquinone biosynthesis protein Coq4
MQNTIDKLIQLPKMVYYSADWGFNPTHTESAIKALEIFLNSKKDYPRIKEMFNKNPELKTQFESQGFVDDMSQNWDLEGLKSQYPAGTLGHEYAVFMQKLGFEPLSINLNENIPPLIQNLFRLSVRNHDLIHFLFGLYDFESEKLSIVDFHEWVFLVWANEVGSERQKVVDLLLMPSRLKSKFSNEKRNFTLAEKIGKGLAKTSDDINLIWMKPNFGMQIQEVRDKFGIKNMQNILDSESSSE